ncbi:MAG: hypothetical protein HRU29_02120 [Rhizobiales bacterium]|nr:hypothetical protein [Hyphomicrobiales bacterium]NRB13173.1 hypothetical protein [Hyphomicrobiales bacterium]
MLIETRTQKTIYELVRTGAGISILDPLATSSQDTDIVIKPFIPAIIWNYLIIQLEAAPPSLNAKSFTAMLMQHFS